MRIIRTSAVIAGAALIMSCGSSPTESKAPAASTDQTAEANQAAEMETFVLVEAGSAVHWMGQILGLKAHDGTVNPIEGHLDIRGDEVIGGNFLIDMNTINPMDENYTPEGPKEGLVGHLSSADFFDVANHPTAQIILMEEGKAKMTVRGVTKEVQIEDIQLTRKGEKLNAKGSINMNRMDFGVSFQKPGDVLISDNVELKIDITLIQKK